MPIELQMLGWSAALGLAYVLIAAGFSTYQRDLKWNAGNRDGEPKPLTGMAARVDRASRNFLETFAFFAAAVLIVVVAHRTMYILRSVRRFISGRGWFICRCMRWASLICAH